MKSVAFSLSGSGPLSQQPLMILLVLGYVILFSTGLNAQERVCGTMEHLEQQLQANPGLRYNMQLIEQQTEENIKGASQRVNHDIVIPVVVHVVYATAEQNISDAQIHSQITVLNQDFRRQNPDKSRTLPAWQPVAADTRISFRLANRDPQGNPTSGITRTRTQTEAFYVQSNGVKYAARGGVDPWPTDQYLNIWACNLGRGVLGYSQFPGGPAETDGVVIGYRFFGTTGMVAAPFNGGRTCTHEVGHWLNLRHIWGDGPCSEDDHVADTPPSDRPTQGCPAIRNACSGPVMTSNYMDYTNDACMNLFTFGQADRMQALFFPGGPRESLLFSRGYVEESPRPQPVAQLDVELVSPSSARLIWGLVDGAESYNVRFRRQGSDRWLRRNFINTEVSTSGLQPCTDYEFQMEPVINGLGGGFSSSRFFRTGGCPGGMGDAGSSLAPLDLQAFPDAPGEIALQWQPVAGASGYRVQIKPAGSRNVKSVYTSSPSLTLQGIRPGKTYFWRVRADFNGENGPFSQVKTYLAPADLASGSSMRVAQPSPVLEIRPQHVIRDGDLPLRLNLDAPAVFSARILNDFGEEVRSFPERQLNNNSWLRLPIQGLLPGRYRIILQDPDGFELVEEVLLQ